MEDGTLEGYSVIKMDVTKMTREALKDITMGVNTGCITRTWIMP